MTLVGAVLPFGINFYSKLSVYLGRYALDNESLNSQNDIHGPSSNEISRVEANEAVADTCGFLSALKGDSSQTMSMLTCLAESVVLTDLESEHAMETHWNESASKEAVGDPALPFVEYATGYSQPSGMNVEGLCREEELRCAFSVLSLRHSSLKAAL